MVCGEPSCQRRRRADYHRKKLETDPLYRQVVRDSQRQWWDEHPDYQKQRRQYSEVVAANRQRQRQRDQKRRIERLVRNNLALDLKASAAGIWLLTPQGSDLDRNNLASAQVLIFQQLSSAATATTVS